MILCVHEFGLFYLNISSMWARAILKTLLPPLLEVLAQKERNLAQRKTIERLAVDLDSDLSSESSVSTA